MTDDQGTLFDDGDPPVRCPTCRGTGQITAAQLRERIQDQPGQVGHVHPDTSRRAARPHPRFGTQRYRVLDALSDQPRTAAEVAARIGLSRNQTATRMGELRQDGFVAYLRDDDGARVERPTGPRDAGLVQTLTALGMEAIGNGRT